MRFMAFNMVLINAVLLSACGQTGALQLSSDPNYDHRAKYLIKQPKATESSNQVESSHQPAQE